MKLRLADFDAVVVDLDGVVTDTASVHAAAWTALFEAYFAERAQRTGDELAPFGLADYHRFVDGKPRPDGVRHLLASRGVSLPDGDPSDPPGAETVWGLGNRKNRLFQERLERDGIAVFDSTVALLERARREGLRTALFSASRNTMPVIRRAGVEHLFDAVVDGVEAARLGLPGKPDPAVLLEAAKRVGVRPERAVLVEDAEAGVEAARRGGFGLVVGIDRGGHARELRDGGADVVVGDLGEVELV